ncbi:MAG: AAA family ATPase [Ketobacteraceae bacterium]|nr:AAA family ATPase [Ketobacteraceae bacterium]
MYESFFGLKETPFSIAPNPHYLYMSKQHNEALAHLVYGVGREGGFVLLTGEVGTGKTTICRCFLEQIPENTDVAFILNPKLSSDELLATICDELSVPYIGDSMTIKDYVDYINSRLLSTHAKGRHTVLIIDEAQNLAPEVLEQLRLLTNLETHEKKLLQIVLLGQPELQDMFQRKELRQLAQRVTARFHLDALKMEEIEPYITHRLAVAGAADPRAIFPRKTLKSLYQITKGIPRIINLVCDRAMLGAYTKSQRYVDPQTLKSAAEEVLGKHHLVDVEVRDWWRRLPKEKIVGAIGLAMICGLSAGIGVWFSASLIGQQQPVQTQAATAEGAVKSEPAATATRPPAGLPPPPPRPLSDTGLSEGALASAPGAGTSKGTLTDRVPSAAGIPPQTEMPGVPAAGWSTAGETDEFRVDELFTRYDEALSEEQAYAALLAAWGIDYDVQRDGLACQYAKRFELACLNKIGSLGSLRHMGLPAVLTFFSDTGEKHYAFLRTIGEEAASFIVGDQQLDIPIDEIDQIWRGHFVMLWKVPPDYKGPLQPGTIGPLTKWVSMQLDLYEGVPNPVPGRAYYDDNLVERVKNFQRDVGEQADGIVGINTLIQLSKYTDSQIPLLVDSHRERL